MPARYFTCRWLRNEPEKTPNEFGAWFEQTNGFKPVDNAGIPIRFNGFHSPDREFIHGPSGAVHIGIIPCFDPSTPNEFGVWFEHTNGFKPIDYPST